MTNTKKKTFLPHKLITRLSPFARAKNNPDAEFKSFLEHMNSAEKNKNDEIKAKIRDNYQIWSEHFEFLSAEFNALWDFFQSIEAKADGWHCVSPTLSKWKGVGRTTLEGYIFSACIMKNKAKNAPMAEKSLSISFGLEQWYGGIGDETEIGRTSEVDDKLCGLEHCTGKSLEEQLEGSQRLLRRMQQHQLLFRLNHHTIGQETTYLSLDILENHSLIELAQKLFMVLNRDTVTDIHKELGGLGVKFISSPTQN